MPEKTLKEIPRNLKEGYEKGLAAIRKNNLDYAVALLTPLLEQEPAFFDCRQTLRGLQLQRAEGKTGFFKKMFGNATHSPQIAKGQFSARSNPAETLKIAEGILNANPKNGAAHRMLAEAALNLDLPKTAVLSLEILLRDHPDDKSLALKLSEALAKAGNVRRADTILTELAQLYPNDATVTKAYKNLAANRTMAESGYDKVEDGTGSYRDILKDAEESVRLEQENRDIKDADASENILKTLLKQLEADPDNKKILRQIAENLADQEKLDEALQYYERILSLDSQGDPALAKAMSELKTKQFDAKMHRLDSQSPDFEVEKAAIQNEKEAFIIQDCENRAKKYPSDMAIRFELANLYFNREKIGEAIKEFQKSQAHPHYRIRSQAKLGQCFAKRGMLDLAARSLKNALTAKEVFDDEKKDIHYELACILNKMGKVDEAIEEFKIIYESDIDYKDVSERVEAYYAGKNSS